MNIHQDIDFASALNEEQFAAVTAPDGPSLVLAGAGSGKTRTLTYRVAYLLSKGVRPGEILLLTFTNKAAREMLHRVQELTGAGPRDFWGGTFHSIGQRTLRMYGEPVGFGSNFTIMDQNDSEALLTEVIKQEDPKFLKTKDFPKVRVLSSVMSFARNTCEDTALVFKERLPYFDHLAEQVAEFFAKYTLKKRDQNTADYDDLLESWLKLLREDTQVCAYFSSRFRYVLVDEYQDTNRLQADIIDTIGTHHNIMAVGDDAQCIYTWRGADFENIMNFSDRHPGTTVHKIETNYRSSPEILQFANCVLSAQPAGSGYLKELRPVNVPNGLPCVIPQMETHAQARFVVHQIGRILDEGFCLSEIAILYRAHFQAMELQMELTRSPYPFQITSGIRFFDQAHVRDLAAHLRFIYNPGDQAAFARLACLLPRVGDRTAAKIHDNLLAINREGVSMIQCLAANPTKLKIPKDARDDWKGLADTLIELSNLFSTASPSELVLAAVEGWYQGYLKSAYENYHSRFDDLQAMVEFSERFEDLGEMLAELVLLNSESSDKSVDIDDDKIRLTTIHQAKGLEFPVVFVIGLGDGMFPLKRALEEGNEEEERRLFYVAVTRAMKQLYLLYPMITTQGGSAMRTKPSRFINEIPETCYELIQARAPSYY